ncbi:DUF4345 domain-containing protein [Flavobacterium sp.]|uniref:DUF4345 domain-containing protein n=1 Tax=Flavobacterium sp. TaxID=239 RepID=UPI0025EC2C6D|nr:DUF4345 domain-containing protein [Flavobacterium sp.]
MKTNWRQNLHLYISIPVVAAAALIYGFQPDFLFEMSTQTTDENNIYKAIMGLYLCFAAFWFIGLKQSSYWKAATISNMLFMLGLGLGRLISFATDGRPSVVLLLGTIGELTLAVYAYGQLKKSN